MSAILWKIPPIVFLPIIFCASTAYLYMLSVILVSLDGPTYVEHVLLLVTILGFL